MNKSYYNASDHETKEGFDLIVSTLRWTKVCTSKFLKDDGEAITAFFTVVVGLFTAALWLSTSKLWKITLVQAEHIPRVERAYLSGGGGGKFRQMRDERVGAVGYGGVGEQIPIFLFDINNFGKTPGELREIRYGFLPLPRESDDLMAPEPPTYPERLFWQDWYRPGVQSKNIPKAVDTKLSFPCVIFGRLYYRDVFSKWHSSGFVLQLDGIGGSSPIKSPPSYTDERDEPDYCP